MKTAIAIMAWNRHKHLSAVLTSLERTGHHHDVWIFIDGAPAGCSGELRSEIKANVDLAELECEARVVTSFTNAGASKALLSQMDFLFREKGYARVIQLCDDLELSPYYIHNVDHMLNVFEKDQRVGAVSAFGSRFHPHHDPYLNCYTSMANMIGVGMWHDRWEQCTEEVHRYCEIGKESIPEKQQLFKELYGQRIKDDMSFSCDGLLYCSMLKRGQMPVSTVANCLKHVGVDGAYTTPVIYDQLGWAKMPYHEGKVEIPHPGNAFFADAIPKLLEVYQMS